MDTPEAKKRAGRRWPFAAVAVAPLVLALSTAAPTMWASVYYTWMEFHPHAYDWSNDDYYYAQQGHVQYGLWSTKVRGDLNDETYLGFPKSESVRDANKAAAVLSVVVATAFAAYASCSCCCAIACAVADLIFAAALIVVGVLAAAAFGSWVKVFNNEHVLAKSVLGFDVRVLPLDTRHCDLGCILQACTAGLNLTIGLAIGLYYLSHLLRHHYCRPLQPEQEGSSSQYHLLEPLGDSTTTTTTTEETSVGARGGGASSDGAPLVAVAALS